MAPSFGMLEPRLCLPGSTWLYKAIFSTFAWSPNARYSERYIRRRRIVGVTTADPEVLKISLQPNNPKLRRSSRPYCSACVAGPTDPYPHSDW